MAANSKSPWPKNGIAGKTNSARNYAEEQGLDVNDLQILTVGWVADKENRDVADVWTEVL